MTKDNRDNFAPATIAALKQRAAFICSNPNCKCLTIAPSKNNEEKVEFNGIAAHICSAAAGGPRYKIEMTPEERSGINNGIFLCANCSILIDKNNGIDYTEDQLRKWKKDHEDWVRLNLNKKMTEKDTTIINVVSNNQNGGITAGVVNFGEVQRRLTQEQKVELDKNFPDIHENISVLYISGNTESLYFANEIKDYLTSKGFKIDFGAFRKMPEVFGLRVEKNEEGRSILIGYPKK